MVNLGSLFVLKHFFGVWYLASSIVAFVASFFVSFTLQRTWTFEHWTTNGLVRHSSLYLIVAIANTFLNTIIVFVLVEYLQVWYLAAQLVAGLCIAVMSFFIYRKIFV